MKYITAFLERHGNLPALSSLLREEWAQSLDFTVLFKRVGTSPVSDWIKAANTESMDILPGRSRGKIFGEDVWTYLEECGLPSLFALDTVQLPIRVPIRLRAQFPYEYRQWLAFNENTMKLYRISDREVIYITAFVRSLFFTTKRRLSGRNVEYKKILNAHDAVKLSQLKPPKMDTLYPVDIGEIDKQKVLFEDGDLYFVESGGDHMLAMILAGYCDGLACRIISRGGENTLLGDSRLDRNPEWKSFTTIVPDTFPISQLDLTCERLVLFASNDTVSEIMERVSNIDVLVVCNTQLTNNYDTEPIEIVINTNGIVQFMPTNISKLYVYEFRKKE